MNEALSVINYLPDETEAVAEGSPISTDLRWLDSSPEFALSIAEGAQSDVRAIFVLRHSLDMRMAS